MKTEENKYTGIMRLAGKTYQVTIKDGVRYLDGLTVDEFLDRLKIQNPEGFLEAFSRGQQEKKKKP